MTSKNINFLIITESANDTLSWQKKKSKNQWDAMFIYPLKHNCNYI